MLQKDIAAIDIILGDKKFLFGVKPTVVCMLLFFIEFVTSEKYDSFKYALLLTLML